MAAVTKDTIIGDILDMDKTTAPFFMEMGMHCLGARLPAGRRWSRPAWYTVWTRRKW